MCRMDGVAASINHREVCELYGRHILHHWTQWTDPSCHLPIRRVPFFPACLWYLNPWHPKPPNPNVCHYLTFLFHLLSSLSLVLTFLLSRFSTLPSFLSLTLPSIPLLLDHSLYSSPPLSPPLPLLSLSGALSRTPLSPPWTQSSRRARSWENH